LPYWQTGLAVTWCDHETGADLGQANLRADELRILFDSDHSWRVQQHEQIVNLIGAIAMLHWYGWLEVFGHAQGDAGWVFLPS
jgi:hypothetical protein